MSGLLGLPDRHFSWTAWRIGQGTLSLCLDIANMGSPYRILSLPVRTVDKLSGSGRCSKERLLEQAPLCRLLLRGMLRGVSRGGPCDGEYG